MLRQPGKIEARRLLKIKPRCFPDAICQRLGKPGQDLIESAIAESFSEVCFEPCLGLADDTLGTLQPFLKVARKSLHRGRRPQPHAIKGDGRAVVAAAAVDSPFMRSAKGLTRSTVSTWSSAANVPGRSSSPSHAWARNDHAARSRAGPRDDVERFPGGRKITALKRVDAAPRFGFQRLPSASA